METLIVSAYPADLRHRFRIKEAVKKPAKEEEKTPTEVEKSSKEETRGEATYAYTDEVSDFVKKCQVKVFYSPDFRFTRRKHYFTSFYKRLNKKAEDNRLELERSRTEATNGSFVTLEDKLKVLEDMMLTVTAEELKVVESKMEREKEVKVGEEVNEGESRVKSTILDKDGFSGTKNCSDGKGKNSLMWKRLKELLEENNAPKTWADIKITSQKHPIDPSCYGKEVIRKIIHKKKPKRRLKVPFTRGSRLPQRLSRELYEQISSSESSQNVGIEKQPSQNDEKSSQNVGMILNIGRQRPLYHEQFEYLQSFENANFISADWAKLAASAVQPSPTSCKVSRLLIPVLCDKLVKLIECQDELKKFDKNVEYGMERLDMDGEEEEEERKEEEEEEATKRSRIDPAKEYKTDLIRQVEASVEHELSNPPIRDCFVKLVNAKLDQLQKPSPIVNDSDETSENPTPIVNNSDETYIEEICSLPKFNLKVPEHVTRPPLYKIGSTNDVGPSKCKKRKIEESEMVNSSPLSSIVRTEDLNGLKLGSLSSNSDLPAVQQKHVLLNNNSSHNSKVVPDAQKRIKTLKPVLTPRNIDQQPTIPSPDKDGSPKRIKTLQPALPSPGQDGSPKRIKTLQPALPSPGQDGSPKRIKTLQPALPSLGKDGSPKRIKTLLPVLTPRNVDQQPAIPSPDKHDKDGILLPVLSTVNVCSNLAIPEAAPVAKRLKSMEPEPKLAIKIHSVVSLSGGTINPFENNSPQKTNGLVVPTEVRFKEIAGDFEKTTYNNKDVVSRSQYEFGIHILKRDSFSEMVYIPYAYDMKHNEDGYFGMYFHRGTPDTVMVGPFQTNEDPQIFVHRGRNPVCVTLANKWCEDKDFLDTFWNCHNKVLLKHIVKYAYANRAYVYKTRKPQPKFINIIRRSLNVSNHQTLNSTRNLCAEPAPPVELESTESKKVDVDPVEDGENNRVRSLKPAPPVELESTESKKVDVDPVEDGENNRVRSLKPAPPVELESTESKKVDVDPVEDGENNRVRSLKPAPPVELESTESKKLMSIQLKMVKTIESDL
ncbi:uncharacterized protein LOC111058423 isoform X2 [Nilaparvata lugens]|uniref:uncharacterized protein LOC111058423 isoform X2 n=1 Tax=Nilaparvata lugens TaxID=108931 RepID=UPI00193D6614|nr:uncharacterized protein LOC111058423 isoform X2 [Nilaparvata lugens]